ECEVGEHLELILPISHPECPPELADTQYVVHTHRIDSIVDEIVRAVERDGCDRHANAGVVQANAPDVGARPERVSSLSDGQGVAPGERGTDLQVKLVRTEVGEPRHALHSDGSRSDHWMVERGPVHAKLPFVEHTIRED